MYRIGLIALVVAVVATACGGDVEVEREDPVTTTLASAGSTATTQAPGGSDAGPIEFTVGEEVWHSGFRVEIVEGAVTPEENLLSGKIVHTLTLQLSVENLGSEPAFFGPAATVTANTGAYVWDSGFSQAGDIPGGLSDTIELELRVDEGFDPATATIIFGDADENRAVAPLGAGGDAAVRLEPSEIAVSGTLNMQLIDVVIGGGDLRYDVVERHTQVESGKQALMLRFDVVSRKQGSWSIFEDDFALMLPDGTLVAPDGSDLPNISGSADGVRTEGLFVRFLVDEGSSGGYTLRFTPGSWFVGDDGVEQATFEFVLQP
ncbi:MAG: hypothetical protein QY307_09620 [Acidimicrobiia bacterium]|nr:MAG: hypothetical protein QY307_09620 [Acidimicrobiia bacterium]